MVPRYDVKPTLPAMFAASAALSLCGCTGAAEVAPMRVAVASAAPERPTPRPEPEEPVAAPLPRAAEIIPLRLGLGAREIALPAGRSFVQVETAPDRLISIAVFGETDALLGFDVLGAPGIARATSLEEDGLLPRVVSLRTGAASEDLLCVIDARSPVTLSRIITAADQARPPTLIELKADPALARPLVGLPSPASPSDGYVLGVPERYLFARVDVALTLHDALRQVQTRFRGDAIAISDISQWNGVRPASDIGQPHHISHEGGRDVDLALPASDGEGSTIRRHCTGVLIEEDRLVCEPGTSRGVDAMRLAYMLGLIVDRSPEGAIIKIFTDDAYIRDIRGALDTLQRRRWIKDRGYAALAEDDVLRPSAWHTDHVHVRFGGEPGRPQW